MTDFWPDHEPQWNGAPPEEMRGSAVIYAFVEELKTRNTAVTAQEVLAVLSGVIVDLEERLVQMRRQLNEAAD
ncbi:hypothetical protein PBI_EBERT_36 [Gordonia phage Ebert]|uniref:Uncharacterized protein n=1 Tax=Gordonia phage Ebert TaxID=2201426 RepID=A0A2Z4Q426_9CAUD|nr:hypothetical protein PP500_gp36 [Gordonia phage Ebert]AZS12781.1 hypothetical protein SEA_SPROUTIE_35 [Gordonia phage Sproutie]AZS12854.1 hypothetical protein SEA_SAVAGE_35 [Gordonia phage Savage]QCW22517.1 hypothetical protein SEA_HALEY23_35 [Gordonia phage Haley23]QGJ96658.1 hypothetical protein SEA_CYNTHIA_35 [Gordonia phage Cynthia]QOC59158.1 hypothetical protein SEA_GEMG_35 [Gordonia phage GemG]QPL13599.1 hypothetical protein SEA_MOCHA12_35 [Gordonia phage Mocha12]QRI45368.1 hypothet